MREGPPTQGDAGVSYDFWLELDGGGETAAQIEPHYETVDGHPGGCGNYTSNVSDMWADALKDAGRDCRLWELDGQTCGDLSQALELAVLIMEDEPPRFRAMEPSNGWGSYEGAKHYLTQVASYCRLYPKAILRISA